MWQLKEVDKSSLEAPKGMVKTPQIEKTRKISMQNPPPHHGSIFSFPPHRQDSLVQSWKIY